MLKKLVPALIAVLTGFVLYSQTVNQTDMPPDIQNILAKKTLVVAMTASDQAPFYFMNTQGDFAGIDVDIAKEMAKKLGVEVVFNREAKTFNDVVSLVAADRADIAISKLSRTLSRAQYVQYSTPYIVFRQSLLINRLQLAKFTSEYDIKGFIRNFKGKIGVIVNSSYVGYAKVNFPDAEIVEFATWDEVVTAVEAGKILAAYRDELEIKKVMETKPDASLNLKAVLLTDITDPIAIAVKYDKLQLLSWVNVFLDFMNLDLDTNKILKLYADK